MSTVKPTPLERIEHFIKRPLVMLTGALLVPYLTRAISDSAFVANGVLVAIGFLAIVEIYRALVGWKKSHRRAATLAGMLVIGLCAILLWQKDNGFTLLYLGSELNGKEVVFNRNVNGQIRQVEMFIEPNIPNSFGIVGISALNHGAIPLQADRAYLRFLGFTPTPSMSSHGWRLSPDRRREGWTTFEYGFPLIVTSPQHSLPIPDFYGGPVPLSKTKIELALIYGNSETDVQFSLKP